MFRAQRRVIGLDLGGATVKLAHVGFGKGGPELLGAAVVRLPGGAFDESGVADVDLVAGCIREALAEAQVRGTRRVVAGIPGRHLTARLLTVPAMGHVELQEAVKWEAAAYLPYPVEEGYFDCLELGPGSGTGTLEVLALAARRSVVERVSRAIQLADLDPIALDAVPLALGRIFLTKQAASETKEATAIADVGSVNTEVSVFLRGQLRVSRSIPIGGAKFTAAVAEALGLGTEDADRLKVSEGDLSSDTVDLDTPSGIANQALASIAEELAEEISRSLDYFRAQSHWLPISRLLLTGRGSKLRGFREVLDEHLGVAVELGTPQPGLVANLPIGARAAQLSPVSLGLALWEVSEP